MKAVTVIGIGDDGCVGLSSRAAGAIAHAQVLAGGERQLEFFPQFEGRRIVFRSEVSKNVEEIAQLSAENTVCVLASGDPLFYGVGSLIARKVGNEHVEFIPSPTSIQLAFARLGMKWDDATVISLHGRPIEGLVNRLQRLRKVALLTDGKNTPAAIARYLLSYGERGWQAHVCEDLGARDERTRVLGLTELSETSGISGLNVLVLVRQDDGSWRGPAVIPFLDEEDYAKRMPKLGLITKREVRALSLAALRLREGSTVWDIGAGSGSVAIEAAKIAHEGKVFAFEVDPEGIDICRANVVLHKTDNVRVVGGRAPEVLEGTECKDDPDAVFVGGSKGSMGEIIEVALRRLRPRGRLVANAITLDNVSEAFQAFKRLGLTPEVTLLNVSRGAKLASYLRYEALNPIHIFSVTRPEGEIS